MHLKMLVRGISYRRMEVLTSALWDSSHRNLLALAHTKMRNLSRNIKLASGIGGEGRHFYFRRNRDGDLESTQPLAPWLWDPFKVHNLASSLHPFSAFHAALVWQTSTSQYKKPASHSWGQETGPDSPRPVPPPKKQMWMVHSGLGIHS